MVMLEHRNANSEKSAKELIGTGKKRKRIEEKFMCAHIFEDDTKCKKAKLKGESFCQHHMPQMICQEETEPENQEYTFQFETNRYE
jgi:hypothetical protein